jgi:hypothetical protein
MSIQEITNKKSELDRSLDIYLKAAHGEDSE